MNSIINKIILGYPTTITHDVVKTMNVKHSILLAILSINSKIDYLSHLMLPISSYGTVKIDKNVKTPVKLYYYLICNNIDLNLTEQEKQSILEIVKKLKIIENYKKGYDLHADNSYRIESSIYRLLIDQRIIEQDNVEKVNYVEVMKDLLFETEF